MLSKSIVWRGLVGAILLVSAVPLAAHEGQHVLDTSEANMKLIAKSLGVQCTHCHVEKNEAGKPDFEAPSKEKATAIFMQVHFVDSLRTAKGESLTCEGCHQGASRFLPRDLENAKPSTLSEHMPRRDIFQMMKQIELDLGVTCDFCHIRNEEGRLTPEQPTKHKLMAKYMMDHYAAGLQTLDGKPATCNTCHQGKAEFLPR